MKRNTALLSPHTKKTFNNDRVGMPRRFEQLKPVDVLALAIHTERANARRFQAFSSAFHGYDEDVASVFDELAAQLQCRLNELDSQRGTR